MKIEELLDKYFEGETTSEEERFLRRYFSSANVAEHLMVYKPLFAYFDEEIRLSDEKREVPRRVPSGKQLFRIASGLAASILLIIGISTLYQQQDPCLCEENYVVINGRCYTDPDKVRTFAMEALQEVAVPAEDYFPEKEPVSVERAIFENQLRELSDIFSEEE